MPCHNHFDFNLIVLSMKVTQENYPDKLYIILL